MPRQRKPRVGDMQDGELCSWNESGKCSFMSGDVKCAIWEKKDCTEWTDKRITKAMRKRKKR